MAPSASCAWMDGSMTLLRDETTHPTTCFVRPSQAEMRHGIITKRAAGRVGWRIHPVAQALREAAHVIFSPQMYGGVGIRGDAREEAKLFVGQWANGRHV